MFRRSFIAKAALGSIGSIVIPEIVSAAFNDEKRKKIKLKTNDVILFQGDSITDSGRQKNRTGANDTTAMGSGYALMAGAELLMRHPNMNLQIFNRGISGNKVVQLNDRWDIDTLKLKPDVLSILVGVNDYWHTLTANYTGTLDTYRSQFRNLLDRTLAALPDVKLIIGEPFAVIGINAVTEKWYPDFDEYRFVAREISVEYNTAFIPYQSVFDEAIKKAPGSIWTFDGVHPSLAGAKLMANSLLKVLS